MKRILGILLAALLVLTACGGGGDAEAPSWQEQYDLGVRYLSEGNYEEAILAFTAAIAIDPRRTDAYLGLADAYLGQGSTDGAVRVLTEALDTADDPDAIQERLDGLTASSSGDTSTGGDTSSSGGGEESASPQRPAYSGQEGDSVAEFMTDNMVASEEMTIGGTPFYELSIYEAKEFFPPNLPLWQEVEESDTYGAAYDVVMGEGNYCVTELEQAPGHDTLTRVRYTDWQSSGIQFGLNTGVRDIHTGDSYQETLEALGFTAEGARRLSEEAQSIILDFANEDYYVNGTRAQMIELFGEVGFCHISVEYPDGYSMIFDFDNDVLTSAAVQTADADY